MKSYKEYLAEAELRQVNELANLPAAVDSISPIHGRANFADSEKLQRKIKKPNEAVPNNSGTFSPVGGTGYAQRTPGSKRSGGNTKTGRN